MAARVLRVAGGGWRGARATHLDRLVTRKSRLATRTPVPLPHVHPNPLFSHRCITRHATRVRGTAECTGAKRQRCLLDSWQPERGTDSSESARLGFGDP